MGSFYPSNEPCHGRDRLKVVFIETQYINTDTVNFKSVVQRLTGKDSSHQPQHLASASPPPPSPLDTWPVSVASKDIIWPSYNHELLEGFWSATTPNYGADHAAPVVLDKLSSFKDFERMISQLPTQ